MISIQPNELILEDTVVSLDNEPDIRKWIRSTKSASVYKSTRGTYMQGGQIRNCIVSAKKDVFGHRLFIVFDDTTTKLFKVTDYDLEA